MPRKILPLVIALLCFSPAFAGEFILEPQWCFLIEQQPSCIASGDLDNNGMSEIVVGLYSKEVIALASNGQKLWEIRCPAIPNFIRIQNLQGVDKSEIAAACFPYLLLIDAKGELYKQVKFLDEAKQFTSFEVGRETKGSTRLFLLLDNLIYILSAAGETIHKIELGFIPYKLRLLDYPDEGKTAIIVLSEFEIACYAETGEEFWHYSYPFPAQLTRQQWLKQIAPFVDDATLRLVSQGAEKPLKDFRKDLEALDIGDVNRDGQLEAAAVFFDRTGQDSISSSILCFNAKGGQVLWKQALSDAALSIKIVDSLIYAAGGKKSGGEGLGFLLSLNSSGDIESIRRYSSPAYYIRSLENLIVINEYERAIRCHADFADHGMIFRDYCGVLPAYLSEICDLNGDGYSDLVFVFPSFAYPGKFRIDAHLNNTPLFRKKGDNAWATYKTLLQKNETLPATRAREKAERYYQMIGKMPEALSTRKKIEKEVARYRREAIFEKLLWVGILLLPLVGLGYIFKRGLRRRLLWLISLIYYRKTHPTAELLENIDSYIHESSKKMLMLTTTLNEIDRGKPLEETASFFNANLEALKKTFMDFNDQLVEYEGLRGRSAKDLKRLIFDVPPILKSEISDRQKLVYRKKVELLRQRIEVEMRAEIRSFQHTLAEAISESVKLVQTEKLYDLKNFDIRIQDEVARENYPKEISYHDFEHWKMAITNFLRNAIEATVKAVEEENIPSERRVVSIRLNEGYESGSRYVIEIEDCGCGMDEYVRANMFRSGFSFGKKEGTGQGLTPEMEQFILRRGAYFVQTAPGIGTTIRIEVHNP